MTENLTLQIEFFHDAEKTRDAGRVTLEGLDPKFQKDEARRALEQRLAIAALGPNPDNLTMAAYWSDDDGPRPTERAELLASIDRHDEIIKGMTRESKALKQQLEQQEREIGYRKMLAEFWQELAASLAPESLFKAIRPLVGRAQTSHFNRQRSAELQNEAWRLQDRLEKLEAAMNPQDAAEAGQ